MVQYGAHLQIDGYSDGKYRVAEGMKIRHITPFNDFSYAIPKMLSLDFDKIGKTVDARIIDRLDKTPAISFQRVESDTLFKQAGLYLEFMSEEYRFFMQKGSGVVPLLSRDQTELSIKIGTYSREGKVTLTKEFTAFKEGYMQHISNIRRHRNQLRVVPPSAGDKKGLKP